MTPHLPAFSEWAWDFLAYTMGYSRFEIDAVC